MAISSVVKNFRDGTLLLEDATGTPLDVTVQYEAGDFAGGPFSADRTEIATYLDRGDLGSVRKTNRVFPTGSFTAQITDLSDATEETLVDIIKKQNAFAAAVSTLGANADVYTLSITWTVEGTDFGDASDHTLVLDDCHCTIEVSEGDPSTFTISWTNYGTETWT